MDCPSVRELLPEHALGTLPTDARRWVDRHLSWCAGCRKEASELEHGVAVVGLAGPRASPPPDLEERVVAAMTRAAGRSRRSARGVVAAVVAAFLAVGAAVWGVAMAGNAQRLENAARSARVEADQAARRFASILRDLQLDAAREAAAREAAARETAVREAALYSVGPEEAGGRAILYDSGQPDATDWVLVVVGGLPEAQGPYRARLLGDAGAIRLGRLFPSAEGRLAAYGLFPEVAGHDRLLVSDGEGRVVLRGRFAD